MYYDSENSGYHQKKPVHTTQPHQNPAYTGYVEGPWRGYDPQPDYGHQMGYGFQPGHGPPGGYGQQTTVSDIIYHI